MGPSVSFFELQLGRGYLAGLLGSGESEAVTTREVPAPYMRICMRDPEVVEYRVRLGTAELTEGGLEYGDWDDFQFRGSSIRLFSWSLSIARWMAANQRAVRDLLQRTEATWLEYHKGEVSPLAEGLARQILRACPPEEHRVLIRVEIPQADADEFFTLLNEQVPADES